MTAEGQAFLSYAFKTGISLSPIDNFKSDTGHMAVYIHNRRQVVFDTELTYQKDLLFVVITHELRHGWQAMQYGTDWRFLTAPDAFLLHEKFIEADACAFQEKFLQRHAQRTGQDTPLRTMYENFKMQVPSMPDLRSDQERVLWWLDNMPSKDGIDENLIQAYQQQLDTLYEHQGTPLEQELLPTQDSIVATLQSVRSIDCLWPLSDPQARYLSSLNDMDLIARGTHLKWPYQTAQLKSLSKQFDMLCRLQEGQNLSAPPPKTRSPRR